MIKTTFRMRLCVTLLVTNVIFIWGNSLLPGEMSAAISQWIKNMISAILQICGQTSGEPSEGTGLLRKLAHFTEFTCLGMCFTWLFAMLQKRFWASLLCGFLVACTDETIQCFIPDRGPAVKDVLIDTTGVCLGVALLLLGNAIYKKRKNNTILEETKQ